jgi:hypothetical protein
MNSGRNMKGGEFRLFSSRLQATPGEVRSYRSGSKFRSLVFTHSPASRGS